MYGKTEKELSLLANILALVLAFNIKTLAQNTITIKLKIN